jgi:hypothetical protein
VYFFDSFAILLNSDIIQPSLFLPTCHINPQPILALGPSALGLIWASRAAAETELILEDITNITEIENRNQSSTIAL